MTSAPYSLAREEFAQIGIETEEALELLGRWPVSLQCWQGDDVRGFEKGDGAPPAGLLATGAYPGKASTVGELMQDLEKTASLVPGSLRLNLHAIYASDLNGPVSRDELEPGHFQSWIDWASARRWGLDFNPSFFSHPMAAGGFTLASPDETVRRFWVRHGMACRRIGAAMGKALQNPAVTNLWIPDGYKDQPADRAAARGNLLRSLDEIFADDVDAQWNRDALESKLFGIGVESFTAGSHEFYTGYAVRNGLGICLDSGHFHPTESVADKISSLLFFVPFLLLHVSRGVRWDSDHVVSLDDSTQAILEEAVLAGSDRVVVGMDFFDASINRIAAWVIGARNTKKGLLRGLLRPNKLLREAEASGDYTARLAILEESRALPWGAVWAEYCRRNNTPEDGRWMEDIRRYEREVLSSRG